MSTSKLPDRTVLIGCTSGLCNRLRMISNWLGRVQRARFLWSANTACPAHWEEIFEPLENLTITKATDREANRHKKPLTQVRSITLNELTPCFEIPRIHEDYVALHIRRTDHARTLAKNQCISLSDEVYFGHIERLGIDRIYLATDNLKTQSTFKKQYKERLIVHNDIRGYGSNIRPVRCTPMQHAVADLYQCARAKKFLGSPCSSFSGMIALTRHRSGIEEPRQTLDRIVFATSIAPKRLDRQKFCIETWKKYGYPIVAIQSNEQQAQMVRDNFTGVQVLTQKHGNGDALGKPFRVQIRNFAKYAEENNTPILLVNSDIEFYSSAEQFEKDWLWPDEMTFKCAARCDYDQLESKGSVNPHGIDAFRFLPGQGLVNIDLPLPIGIGFWDTWVVFEMQLNGYHISCKKDSDIRHERHELNWTPEDRERALKMFLAKRPEFTNSFISQSVAAATGRTECRLRQQVRR